MSKIIVLQGVPASGKSTWAKKKHEEDNSYVIVNRDSIRRGRGEYWIPSQEDYITDIETCAVVSALKHNLNVIIDATNLNQKSIDRWEEIAKDYNAELEYKKFYVSYNEALKRDKEREYPVGEKVLKNFFYKYFPDEMKKPVDNRAIIEFDSNLPNAILVDLDGTVSLRVTDRTPYEYGRVGEDMFDPRMKVLLNSLQKDVHIIFLSGREATPECVAETTKWLNENYGTDYQLVMRDFKDHRHDNIVKEELYEKNIRGKYNVICVFEDRDKVVKMWRDKGILCNQVYYGDF